MYRVKNIVSPKFLRCKQGGGSNHQHHQKTIRSTPVARYVNPPVRPTASLLLASMRFRLRLPLFHTCVCVPPSHSQLPPSPPQSGPEQLQRIGLKVGEGGGGGVRSLRPSVRPTTRSIPCQSAGGSAGRANQLLTTVLTYHHCTLASALPTFTNKQQDRRKSVRSRNWA